jgi:hypothetical protein
VWFMYSLTARQQQQQLGYVGESDDVHAGTNGCMPITAPPTVRSSPPSTPYDLDLLRRNADPLGRYTPLVFGAAVWDQS